jgi:hypothetical protein
MGGSHILSTLHYVPVFWALPSQGQGLLSHWIQLLEALPY